MRGGRVRDYPHFKLLLNRIVNLGIRVLFRHGYNDTTNAFKAYRREVIDHIQPLLSNHFNLTVEMPLKALVRGHFLRGRPDLLDQPGARRLQAAAAGDGQPLPVHHPLRLPRAPPQPRRLPPARSLGTDVRSRPQPGVSPPSMEARRASRRGARPRADADGVARARAAAAERAAPPAFMRGRRRAAGRGAPAAGDVWALCRRAAVPPVAVLL